MFVFIHEKEEKMEQKLLSEVVGLNVKRAIHLSQYRTQEEFSYVFGTPLRNVSLGKSRGQEY